MQSSLDQLQDTIDIVETDLCFGRKTAPLLRFHINALQEDIEFVSSIASSSGQLSVMSERLILARKVKRKLERLLVDLETLSGPAASPQPVFPKTPFTEHEEIEFLRFDGDASTFQAYWNCLEENVINNPNMPVTTKWARFRSSLSGPPDECISVIPQIPELLDVALKLLDNVYGSEGRARRELYMKFHDLPPAEVFTRSLRKTHLTLEAILLSLAHLNYPVNGNPSIRSLYIRKFPDCVINAIDDIENATLQTIRDNIESQIVVFESKQK